MRRVVATALAIAVGVWFVGRVSAGAIKADASYAGGHAAYQRGDWREAIRQYELLVSAQIAHPDLYSNLGTAYAQLGQYGSAVYNYERAIALESGHRDARHNLKVLRAALAREAKTTSDNVGDTSVVASAYADGIAERLALHAGAWLSEPTVILGLVASNAIVFLAFTLWWIGGRRRRALLAIGVVCGVVELGLVGIFVGQWHTGRLEMAIVTSQEAPLRLSPEANGQAQATLPAGTRLRILSRRGSSVQIRLASGEQGWLDVHRLGEL